MDSLIETVRVRRSGFCYRLPYQQFLSRYKMLSLHTWPNWQGPPVEGVSYLIRDLPIPSGEFAFGRTKVFVRSPRTVSQSFRYRYSRPGLYKSQVPGCLVLWKRVNLMTPVKHKFRSSLWKESLCDLMLCNMSGQEFDPPKAVDQWSFGSRSV